MTQGNIASELPHFAEQIAALSLTETEKIVALLWFHDHHAPGFEASITNLAQAAERLTLTNKVNIARLKKNLYSSTYVSRGAYDNYIRIRLSSRPNLNKLYLDFLGVRNPAITHDLIPRSQSKGVGPYYEALIKEINGCFSYEFYDGCAALCRRLVESLLISVFTHVRQLDKIQNGKDLMMLADIINVAKSGQHFRLGRGTDKSIDLIKEVGDRAAHHRSHITTRLDIESISVKLRAVVSELMSLADIHPK